MASSTALEREGNILLQQLSVLIRLLLLECQYELRLMNGAYHDLVVSNERLYLLGRGMS